MTAEQITYVANSVLEIVGAKQKAHAQESLP
jgi:hypothetical protein